ncbi:pyruvate dehydrogenase complex E1 component subunit beta [Chitinophaga silvisoli]|nr:pyruvate dehydrogenase complex E1 component subunit beta [Chitinophaga silvisoli]
MYYLNRKACEPPKQAAINLSLLFSPLNNNFAPAFEKNKGNHLSNFKSNSMRQIAFRQALREALQEEMRRDERVFLMGEEVAEYNGAYKVSQGMLDEFGAKRVIDTPIAELGFTAIGVGAAQNGLRPVLEFMTWNFAVLALDQILNTASKMLAMSGGQVGCPIVFRGPNGSAGQLGAQHSTAFESYYANIPGLKVISVSNPYDAKGLLKAAIRDNDPVVFMESEQMYGDMGEVPEEEYIIPIGKADIKRAGRDVTIVSFNKMMKVALGAAEELAKEGIEAEVIDLRTIRPLDWFTILESVKKTNRLVIVEEQWPFSSISSEISYRIQKEGFDYLDAPIRRITAADAPMHYAPNLVKAYLPDVERTVKLVKEVMYMKK